MEAIEELSELADVTTQASGLLADDDPADGATRRGGGSSFLTVVALGNVVRSLPFAFSPSAVVRSVYDLIVLAGIVTCVCAGRREIGGA
jgi:hypothetical protein